MKTMMHRHVFLSPSLLIVALISSCAAQASNMTDFMNQFRMNFANYATFPIPSTTPAPTSSSSTTTPASSSGSNAYIPSYMPSYASYASPSGPFPPPGAYPPPFNSPLQFAPLPPPNPYGLPPASPPSPSSLSSSSSNSNLSPSAPSNNNPFLFSLDTAKSSRSESKAGEMGRGPIEMYNLMAMQKGRAFPVDEFEELYGQGSEMDPGLMNSYGSQPMSAGASPYGFPNPAGQSSIYSGSSPYAVPTSYAGQTPGGGMFPSASSMSTSGFGGFGGGGYGGGYGFPSAVGMGGMSGMASGGFGGFPGLGGYGGLLGAASQSFGNFLSPLLGGQTRFSFGGGGGMPFGMG